MTATHQSDPAEQHRDLPLNGRSYMQLATLEPGVPCANGCDHSRALHVSILGAGNRTLFTIDGGNVSDNIDTGGGISSMNFSQEVVQEFQISTVNFDLSTAVTAGGAINVVTRTGSNQFHGSGYFFFRDHNMAAYPALNRSALFPDPFFARRNPGFWLGGPIVKDKLFFFFNYEHTNQVQALPVQGNVPSLSSLSGIYGSPYVTFADALDYHLSSSTQSLPVTPRRQFRLRGRVFNGDLNWVHNNGRTRASSATNLGPTAAS
jgi:hypothetical protein